MHLARPINVMFAGHALGTGWMGAISALSAGIFEFFSDRFTPVTHTRRTAHVLSYKIKAVRRCASMNFVRL